MSWRANVSILLAGVIFGFGLALSTMVRPEIVLDFLLWRDAGLLLVLGGAASVTAIAYRVVPLALSRPVFGERFDRHPEHRDADTFIGAAIFGAGWGICGVCPGAAIAALGTGDFKLLVALAAMAAGAWFQGWQAGRQNA